MKRPFVTILAVACAAGIGCNSLDRSGALVRGVKVNSLDVGTVVNVSPLAGNHQNGAVALDPSNANRQFVLAPAPGGGLFAAFSADGGQTWSSSRGPGDTNPGDFVIANGNDTLLVGCCDATVAWDDLGNLFAGYVASGKVAIAISKDGGATFASLATMGASVSQPTIASGPGSGGSAGSLWVTYAVTSGSKSVAVQGAKVNGLGNVGAFTTAVTVATGDRGFGDIAVGPAGQVTVAYQTPTVGEGPASLVVHTDPDGFGSAAFGAAITVASTNVGGRDAIPAQPDRKIDAEVGLAYDRSQGARRGRLYLVYADEPTAESNDTDVFVRSSDNNGGAWSPPVRVNDETLNSQFMPRIAVSAASGNVGVLWYDARNDDGAPPEGGRTNPGDTDGLENTNVEPYLATSGDGGATFSNGLSVTAHASAQKGANGSTPDLDLGDYLGLAFVGNVLQPLWADNSNSTGDNPDGTLTRFDLYTTSIVATGNLPPVARCKNASIPADATCKGAVTTSHVDNGSTDPEGQPLAMSLAPPGPFAPGSHPVTLAVTDIAGEVSSCAATVAVVDSTKPLVTAPQAVSITVCSNASIGQATATDNCGTPAISSNKPSKFPLGTTVVIWSATDAAGNVGTATQTVTAVLGDDSSCCPSGTNVIRGTSAADTIVGTSGKDCILGLGGDDTIDGRDGDDYLSGGAGRDTIFAGNGNDRIYGGADNDTLNAAPGTNLLDGGSGTDNCFVAASDTATSCNP